MVGQKADGLVDCHLVVDLFIEQSDATIFFYPDVH